jgi:hypothetical protein
MRALNLRLEKTLHEALKVQATLNVPFVFRDSRCARKNQFIHRYPDGKIFLIQQDRRTSKEVVLKQL